MDLSSKPSHGENSGSSPLGSANKINNQRRDGLRTAARQPAMEIASRRRVAFSERARQSPPLRPGSARAT
jgi:hypothetical protein